MRAGDFSAVRTPIIDPYGSQPFPNNIIPASRVNAAYRNVLPLVPLPNQTGTQNLAGTTDTDHNEDQLFTRIDHKITENDRFFGRYVYSKLIYNAAPLNKNFPTLTRVREQNVVLNWTHVFSPTVLNETRLGYERSIWRDRGPRTDTDYDAGQALGIQGIQTPSGDDQVCGAHSRSPHHYNVLCSFQPQAIFRTHCVDSPDYISECICSEDCLR